MAEREQCLALVLILGPLALATRVTLPRQGHTCVPAPLWWQLSRDRWAVHLFRTLPKPAAPSPPPTVTSLSLYSFWKNTHIHLREPITWHMMLRQSWRKAASTRHHSGETKPNPKSRLQDFWSTQHKLRDNRCVRTGSRPALSHGQQGSLRIVTYPTDVPPSHLLSHWLVLGW